MFGNAAQDGGWGARGGSNDVLGTEDVGTVALDCQGRACTCRTTHTWTVHTVIWLAQMR